MICRCASASAHSHTQRESSARYGSPTDPKTKGKFKTFKNEFPVQRPDFLETSARQKRFRNSVPQQTSVCLGIVTIGSALAPWLRWRFTLRPLLIATTLVAVVLGLIVWLR